MCTATTIGKPVEDDEGDHEAEKAEATGSTTTRNRKRVRFRTRYQHFDRRPISRDEHETYWYSSSYLKAHRLGLRTLILKLKVRRSGGLSAAAAAATDFCLRGLEEHLSDSRKQKKRLFRQALLVFQTRQKKSGLGRKAAKEIHLFASKFTKYARKQARKTGEEDAAEARRIYEESCPFFWKDSITTVKGADGVLVSPPQPQPHV